MHFTDCTNLSTNRGTIYRFGVSGVLDQTSHKNIGRFPVHVQRTSVFQRSVRYLATHARSSEI